MKEWKVRMIKEIDEMIKTFEEVEMMKKLEDIKKQLQEVE